MCRVRIHREGNDCDRRPGSRLETDHTRSLCRDREASGSVHRWSIVYPGDRDETKMHDQAPEDIGALVGGQMKKKPIITLAEIGKRAVLIHSLNVAMVKRVLNGGTLKWKRTP